MVRWSKITHQLLPTDSFRYGSAERSLIVTLGFLVFSSLHIYNVLGNLTSGDDVREFLFGLGVQYDIDLFADRRSLLGVGERLVERLLEIRRIFLQALRQINEQCPIYGEDIVRIPLGYFKAQIEAVDKREASLVPVCECALPTLRLVT